MYYINGLAQDCNNSCALAMGLLQYCAKPSIWLVECPGHGAWSLLGMLSMWPSTSSTLRWRHNEPDSVSNHQFHDCLLNGYSGADQRKDQSSASLAFARGIHRWPVNSPHKGPVMRKMLPFNDVIMKSLQLIFAIYGYPICKQRRCNSFEVWKLVDKIYGTRSSN